jgi:serine/threonine protein kinase
MDTPGTLIAGRYELLEVAGRGGMATVWRAALRGAASFETTVAVKRMLPALAEDPHLVTMFVEEAKIAAGLTHPNVTRVYDLGVDADGFYLVMEWVDGIDLSRFVRSYREHNELPPWSLVVQVVIDALRGLESAHARRGADGALAPVFHRDVDPYNVLIGTNGIAKLTDFGLAFAVDRARLTQPGMLKGKLGYVAPELLEGGAEPSSSSDLYGMGIVLWESLAGKRLFLGETDLDTLARVQRAEVPSLRVFRNDLPDALVQLVAHALERQVAYRLSSAEEMFESLEDLLLDEGIRTSTGVLGRAVVQARKRLKPVEAPSRAAITAALGPPAAAPRPASKVPPPPPPRTPDTPAIPLQRRK